jgi:MFS family permease
MFCRSMVFPYASLYILALGGEPAEVGLVNSLRPLAGLLVFPLAGYLCDRTGRVRLVTLSGYFSGAILLLYVLAPSWQAIALAGLLQGFVVIQFPPTSAIIADSLSPANRGRGVATMSTISSTVAILAPYLAGALLDLWDVEMGMRVLYGVMMVAYLANATIHWRFLKETSAIPPRLGRPNVLEVLKTSYGDIPATLRSLPRSTKALATVVVLGFTANAVAGPFWVVYAAEQIGLSSTEWGLVLLVEVSLRSLAYIPAGLVVDRHGRAKAILGALLLTLVVMSLFTFAQRFVHVLLIRAAAAVAMAFFLPACSALMADTVPRDMRGRVMAAIGRGSVMIGAASGGTGGPGMGFVVTIPVMVGSLLGGYLYAFGPRYPWFFAAAAVAISFGVSALWIRDPQNAEI